MLYGKLNGKFGAEKIRSFFIVAATENLWYKKAKFLKTKVQKENYCF